MKSLYQIIINYSVKRQMYLIFCIVFILPLLLLGTILTEYLLKIISSQSFSQIESDNLRSKSILLDSMINLYTITDDLIRDKSLYDLLISDYASSDDALYAANLYSRLQNYHERNTDISNLHIYTDNPMFDTPYITSVTTSELEEYYGSLSILSSYRWEIPPKDHAFLNAGELTLSRSIPLTQSDYSAILVISMSNNFIKNRIYNNTLYTSISLDNGPVFFSTIRSDQGDMPLMEIDYMQNYFTFMGLIPYDGDTYYGHISTLPTYPSTEKLYITTIDFQAKKALKRILLISISIISISIIVPFSIIAIYSSLFSNRLRTLRSAMAHASHGNYDIITDFKGDDELAGMFNDLQKMIVDIQKKEADIYQNQLHQKELLYQQQQTEFLLLTSQINPHYIYNTLETIRMMALSGDIAQVSKTIRLFGHTLRYVLDHTQYNKNITTLGKELWHIDSYLQIQQLRFQERLSYSILLPDDFQPDDYQTLPLILQPIVENAVLHGIESLNQKGEISISLKLLDSDNMSITIQDNGIGIAPDILNQLNGHKSSGQNHKGGIGISNIQQRIKLSYGAPYGLKIDSNCKNGTQVVLYLPLLPVNS